MAIPMRRTSLYLLIFSLLTGCRSTPSDPALTSSALIPQQAATPLLAMLQGTLTGGPEAALSLEPVRDLAAIGDIYSEVGLTSMLFRRFAESVAVTRVERITPQAIEVTLRVKHPYSLANRPDLHAFNLKAHVQTPPSLAVDGHWTDPGRLLNADGYSTIWSTQVPDGETGLMPYRILSEDRAAPEFDPKVPTGWNVFAAGSSHESTLQLALPEGIAGLPVALYLTADFGQSAVFNTRQTPRYLLPEFAGKAPWKVRVTTLRNELGAAAADSSADYRLEVWHWTQGTGSGVDVRTPLRVQLPALQPDIILATLSGTGTDSTPLTADFSITNQNRVGEGRYLGVIRVETVGGLGYALKDDLVTPFPIKEFSTWQLFWAEVGASPPIGDPPIPAIAAPCSSTPLAVGRPVTFDAHGTVDTEHAPSLLTYEWDIDYSGTKFLPEVFGPVASGTYDSPGARTVALAVTDPDGNRVMVTTAVEVLEGIWVDARELDQSLEVTEHLLDARLVSDSLLFDPAGQALLFANDPSRSGSVRMVRFGQGCPPVASDIPLGITRLPEVGVRGGIASLLYIEAEHELRWGQLDISAPAPPASEFVFRASDLLEGSVIRDRALLIAPATGRQLAVAQLVNPQTPVAELWGAEWLASSGWSTPFRIAQLESGSPVNVSDLALGMTSDKAIILWADVVPGRSEPLLRKTRFASYSFGSLESSAPIDTGYPVSEVSGFVLRSTPEGGLCGLLLDAAEPQPQYLRFDPLNGHWSRTALGNLSGVQQDGRLVLDSTGMVTALWRHQENLVSKRFVFDAATSVIGDGAIAVIHAPVGGESHEPQLAVESSTGRLAIAWLVATSAPPDAPGISLWGATW